MPLAYTSDAGLVARCRAGDEAAWAQLVERFSRYVYAIAVQGYRLSQEDAEDVFQEAFARTFERLDSLRDDGAIRPWLAQLTRRLAIDRLRTARRDEPRETIDASAADAATLATLDDALTVRETLLRLPEHCREVLDRFFARDQDYRTIAEALAIPAGTIASRISRCLRRLRLELEQGAWEPA
jgi:RNA polymerase sigma factor (sigma-70 family)